MKFICTSKSFCFLILFSVSQNCISQNESLKFDHIGIEEGLSNEKLTAIVQDRKGFLWFGTANGLYKYDGYTFVKYQFDPSDPSSLSQNFVYTIFKDGDGTIWTSTYEGLCRYNETTDNFTRYRPVEGALFSNPNIFAINEDGNGMLWVGSAAGELCRFDKRTGKFLEERLELKFNTLPGEGPPKRRGISCIYKDKSGTLWVGNTTGLHQVVLSVGKKGEPSTVSFKTYRHDPYNPNSLSSNYVRSVLEDQTGIIWVSTDSGLSSFDRKTGMFKRYRYDPRDSHSISSNNLWSWSGSGIKEDQEGNLWICTDSGLNKLNRERTVFSTYLHNPLDPSSISSDIIRTIFVDREGVLWAGSPTGKLNKTVLNRKAFGLRRNDPDNSNSLSDNKVTAIVADSAGIFWIGTNGGGLNRWHKKSNNFTHFRHKEGKTNSLKSDAIGAMIIDRKGQLWIGNGEFLSRFNTQTNEFIHYKSSRRNHNEEGEASILTIAQDQQGLLWLGTRKGVKSFEENSGKFTHYEHNPADTTGLSDYSAVEIFVDTRNDVWIGLGSIATERFEKSKDKFFHYRHDPFDTTSISANIVNSFFEDAQGNIWMGTWSGGLCYFNYRTGKFSTFTEKHGLPDNIVYSILKDNQDHLWLSTGNGISRFDPVKKIFTNYDYKDGLQNNNFGAGTTDQVPALDKDGILYFGGRNGFNFFDPMEIKRDSTIAPIVITQFKLFDEVVKGATELPEIVLEYNKNYFSFEFSSLSFFNPVKNQYKYQLEGVDKDWVHSGSRHYAGYTNIAPGKYVFKVKGTNNDGIWNEKGTSLIVIIKPPWWLSWWAYFFYGVCVISGLYIIARYQRRRVINKERERTREKELEQAREIEKAYHELKTTQAQLIQSEKMASLGELTAGIAHEIQNPLNFVNNFSEVNTELLEEMKAAIASGNISELNLIATDLQSNLEKINQHGKRADGIVKSMMLHSRQGSVQKEPTDINNLADEYLRLSYHGHRAKDKSFNATIKTDFDENIGKVSVVPQELGRVLLNIYNNAFYALSARSSAVASTSVAPSAEKLATADEYQPTIEVNTRKLNDVLELRIRDNGNGIPSKIRDKIFQPFFTTKPTGQGTGLGLSMSYDIIKMHQGELNMITEEGVGTEFIIRLPVK